MNIKKLDSRVEVFNHHVGRFAHAVKLPNFDLFSVQVPVALIDLLNRALFGLVAFDYRDRVGSLEETRRIIDTCVRILDNSRAEERRSQRRRQFRLNRLEKLQQRERRLAAYLKESPKRIQGK
jgi:hypothetical protein